MSKDMPFGHYQLHNRYRFIGTLQLETPLKIASGVGSADTDAPVIRDLAGQPYIPGSSLRGAVRSELERVLAAVGPERSGLRGCVLFTDDPYEKNCEQKIREFLLKLDKERLNDDDKNKKLAEYLEKNLCDICRVFGTAGYGSKLFFSDCPSDNAEQRIMIRDNVGIDRDSGAAADTAKFDYEVIEAADNTKAATRFSLCMEAENLDEQGKSLVRLVLNLLRNGLYLGGKRAAGLGRIVLHDWSVRGCDSPKEIWAALLAGDRQGRDLTEEWKKELGHA